MDAIVLVNYNGFEDTKACLQSIQLVTGDLPYVILVDNASKTPLRLEVLKEEYAKLQILYSDTNVGFGRANNLGIKWAQEHLDFDYLLLLNNDTTIEPDTLENLKSAFNADKNIGITTGKTMFYDTPDLVWYGGGDINYTKGWPVITDFEQVPTESGANRSRFVSFASGCVMMFSRKSIAELQGFDDVFFMYCEDLELSIRALKSGYKIYYESKSLIFHKVQGSLGTKNKIKGMRSKNPNLGFLIYHMKSNQWITMRKHLQGLDFAKFSVYYWFQFAYSVCKFLAAGRFDILKPVKQTVQRINQFKA